MSTMEQTLFICKEVSLFRIPPRTGRGHLSGEWRVEDKLFTPRCRVVAVGKALEVRLEDASNGEIFGVCPVPLGQRSIAVESAIDSSRNFVLRIVDPATKRHAFLGMNFAERTNAFDFNVALTDFDRHLQREEEMGKIAASADPVSAAQSVMPEAAALYKKQDLALNQGESIKIEVKRKPAAEGAGGFLSRLAAGQHTEQAGSTGSSRRLAPPAPPTAAGLPAMQPAAKPAASPAKAADDVLGAEAAAAAFGDLSFQGAIDTGGVVGRSAPGLARAEATEASSQQGWATF